MGIIDRLLMREILKTLFVTVLIIVLVLLSNILVRYLGKAAVGSLSTDILVAVVGLEVVRALGLIVPPAFFFSVLWVVGRMYRDSEMVALAASGYGHLRLFRSVFLAAIPLALLVGVLVMELLPWARASIAELKASHAESADISAIRAGRFNEFSRGGLVVYTESLSVDAQRLSGVFLQDRQQGQLGLVTARDARQETDPESGERYVVLTDGRRYEGQPGDLAFGIASFDEYRIRLPRLDAVGYSIPTSAKPTAELLASDDPRDVAEFQYRLSMPLALVAFAALAVPLARTAPRTGVYGRLTFAVLLYFTFMNLQRVAERWLETGTLPLWLGMWWLPLVMLLAAGLIVVADSNWFAITRRRWQKGWR